MARTLDDLARLSGVSRATVSRVINGGPVAEETRQKVLEVLATTNYRPHLAARSLASGRTGVVGVVMHVAAQLSFSDYYFSGLLTGISDSLSEKTLGMMLWLGNRTKQETLDQIVGAGMLDGVIVTADMLDDPLVDGLRSSDMPTVLVGHRREDSDASYVDINNVASAEAATEHLISVGRRRIGHITGRPNSVSAHDRIDGYEQTMHRAGLSTKDLIAEGDYEAPRGFEAAAELLDRGVDAIFCASDKTAQGALAAVEAAGLRTPEDVALVGFDDIALASEMDPPLTTVRQDVHALGLEAARVLGSIVDNPGAGPRRVLLPTELIVRQSSIGASKSA